LRGFEVSFADPAVSVAVVRRDPESRVLAVRGELSRRSVGVVAAALTKALLDVGRVLVDVSALRVRWAPAVQVFASTTAALDGWPWSRLVLFGADPPLSELLDALRVSAMVPLAADEPAARRLLEQRPAVVVRRLDLDDSPVSPRRARSFVAAACAEWGVGALCDDAVIAASELVSNAVQHARTECRLTLRLDEQGLTVEVRDYRPGPLTLLRPVAPGTPRGLGLIAVAATCRHWGVTPTEDGKAVWARLVPPGSTGHGR